MSLQAVPRPVSPQPPAKLYTPGKVHVVMATTWPERFSCLKTFLNIADSGFSPRAWLKARIRRMFVRLAKVEMALLEMYDENFWQVRVIGGFVGCLAAFALTAYVVITVMSQWPE